MKIKHLIRLNLFFELNYLMFRFEFKIAPNTNLNKTIDYDLSLPIMAMLNNREMMFIQF